MDNNENLVIFHKYEIRHVDGTPLKGKKYFVLRLDSPDPKESARVNAAMAAYKGESLSANSKAWRDELEEILRFLIARAPDGKSFTMSWGEYCALCSEIRISLASKARNCDIGTPEEQAKRFYRFCQGHASDIKGLCDLNCPCLGNSDKCHCMTQWMQLPYTEKKGSRNDD